MKTKYICIKLISVLLIMSSENEVEGLAASTAARWKKVDYLSLGTYASASICAGLEIAEDVSEVGHGM